MLKNLDLASFSGKTHAWLAGLLAALYFLFSTKLSLSNVALLLIIVTFIFTCRGKEYGGIFKRTPVLWALVGLYGVVLAGVFYTSSTSDWVVLHLTKYAKFIYAAILIFLLTGRENLQKIAFKAFIAAMLFTLISTWLNVWVLLPWSITQDIGWGKTHHVFGDYITQNVMMAFFTVIAVNQAVHASTGSYQLLWGLTAVLATVSISHLSQGRTGLVLLAVGLVAYALSAASGKWIFRSLLGVALTIALAFASSSMLQDRFRQAVEEAQRHEVDQVSSIGHRLYNYKITPQLIAEKPLFGYGTGAYHTEICRFIEKKELCSSYNWHTHNQFLLLGADHGILGMALYVLLIFSLYRTALRSPNLEAKVLLGALTSILLVDSLINSPFYSSRESQFFAYMLALLVSMAWRPSTSSSTSVPNPVGV